MSTARTADRRSSPTGSTIARGAPPDRLGLVVQAAVDEGLLPAGAQAAPQDARPWPVVLLTALGAWLATLPLLGVVLMLFDGVLGQSAVLYSVGTLLLVGAVVVLRAQGVALFVEQLAVPALLIGGGAIAFALFRDLSQAMAALALAILSIGVPLAIPKAWVRVPLGALAAVLLVVAWASTRYDSDPTWTNGTLFWTAWHADLVLWLALGGLQVALLNGGTNARLALAVESMRVGVLIATLAGLAWWSGMTFLVGGVFEAEWVRAGRSMASGPDDRAGGMALQVASVALSLVAAWWASRGWPTLRHVTAGGVAVVGVAMAWFMPSLGAVWLALAVCVTASRWRLAALSAVAAAWIIGAFYYALGWSLGDKALVLVLAGALLAAFAWLGARHAGRLGRLAEPVEAHLASAGAASSTDAFSNDDASSPVPSWHVASPRAASALGSPPAVPSGGLRARAAAWPLAGVAVTALLVLLVANGSIWQKERSIANGLPVFVELAPVDPRSLAQGDYMALGYRMLRDERLQALPQVDELISGHRPKVVVMRDARGVAALLRVDDGAPLGPGEMRIELAPSRGRWTVVTDAWFFREGDSARWARARYAEFRVGAEGAALLVGLRGPALEVL